MSDRLPFQVCSREESMSHSIAFEAQKIVRDAASPVPPGETVKGQMRRAASALGFPGGHWRVRAAWNGEAGCWSAKAFEDLRERYAAWDRKQRALADAKKRNAAAVFAALAGRLEATEDADFHRNEIAALCDLARRLGDSDAGGHSEGV